MPFEGNYQAPQVPGGYVSMQDATAKAQTLRSAVESAAQNREINAQTLQSNAIKLEEQKQDQTDQKTMRDAYMQSGGDMQKFQQLVMSKGASPRAIQQIQAQMVAQQEAHAKLDEQQLKNEALKAQAIGAAASGLLQAPDEATRTIQWPAIREQMLKQGHATAGEIPEQYPGEQWITLHRNMAVTAQQGIENTFKQRTTKAAEDTAAARKATADTAATKLELETPGLQADAQAKQRANLAAQLGATKTPEEYEAVLGALPYKDAKPFVGKTAAQARQLGMTPDQQTVTEQQATNAAETKRHNNVEEGQGRQRLGLETQRLQQDKEDVNLTPEALDKMAEMFATTGQLPALGMGKASAAMRSKIINRSAEKFPTVQFATNKAAYQANQSSLKTVTATLDNLTSFENTSIKNLKMFTDAADKLPDSGIPWLNTPLRLLDEKLVGSTNMSVVNAARQIGLREIARVTSDPRMMGQLSDNARHEVMGLSPENATIPQIKAVAALVQQDVKNLHESLTDQKKAIVSRIGTTDNNTSEAPAAATHVFNPATGRIEEKKK